VAKFSRRFPTQTLLRVMESINQQIYPTEDDIRCYRWPEHTDIKTLGRQFFPDNMMLFTDGINRLFSGQ
jgi:CRISPR-associated protein Cas2